MALGGEEAGLGVELAAWLAPLPGSLAADILHRVLSYTGALTYTCNPTTIECSLNVINVSRLKIYVEGLDRRDGADGLPAGRVGAHAACHHRPQGRNTGQHQ